MTLIKSLGKGAQLYSYLTVFLLLLVPFWNSASFAAEEPVLLTPEQSAWLADRDYSLRVGMEAGYRPYAYVNEDGDYDGLAGDYLRLLEERLGITFEILQFANFAETLNAASNREIDIVPFAQAAPERQVYLDFTEPYHVINDSLITRDDQLDALTIDDLDGMQVGVIEGYSLQTVLESERPEIDLVPMASELDGIRALALGNLDVLIAELGVVSTLVQENAITNLRVVGEMDILDLEAFGTRNDEPILNEIISAGLESISQVEREAIAQRWVSIDGLSFVDVNRLYYQIAIGLLIMLAAASVASAWILSLRRQVTVRTQALEEQLYERRQAESANYRLASAIEQSAEYILMLNSEGIVEYANMAFLQESDHLSVLGRSFESIVAKEHSETIRKVIDNLEEEGVWRGRLALNSRSDEKIKVNMTISPISSTETGAGFVATARNISHEEALEERLRHGEKLSALGTLAGGIAHDFNNLLVPILGYVDLIRDESTNKAAPYLESIEEAGNRAKQLIQRILTFSRQHKRDADALNLKEEVEKGTEFLRSLLPPSVDIKLDLSNCCRVYADPTEVQQIILNLGANAFDAMRELGGTLTLSLSDCPSRSSSSNVEDSGKTYCCLVVKDTGVGIVEKDKKRIFDPYFTNKPIGKGTGLGLSIVHGIVQSLGGSIEVESQPGEGTSFKIFLPTVIEQISEEPKITAREIIAGHGEEILLIDDDEMVLTAIGKMLNKLGYGVTTESDPEMAVSLFQEKPDAFKAIVTDYTMPKLAGDKLAEQVHSTHPDMPVILMTGKTDLLDSSELVSIAKPFKAAELANCLQRVL